MNRRAQRERRERVTKVEQLAAQMLPRLYGDRHKFGMGLHSIEMIAPLAVKAAEAIVREAKNLKRP